MVAREGDFLLCRRAAALERLGRGALMGASAGPVALAGSMVRIRVRPEVLDPQYLGCVWESSGVREQLEAAAGGNRMRSLAVRALHDIRFVLPPPAQQRRILDVLHERLQRLERGSQGLHRAAAGAWALHEAAPGALTPITEEAFASSLPHGWAWRRLGEVIGRIEAGRALPCEPRPAHDDAWGVIKTSAMTRGSFLETENKQVGAGARVDERHEIRAGDILLCRANSPDHVGAAVRVAACRPGLLLSDKSLRLLPAPNVDANWLAQLLATSYVRDQIEQRSSGTLTSMRNISQARLRDILIPVAPAREQQRLGREAAAWQQAARHLQVRVKAASQSSGLLRRALVDAAVTGRLVPPAGAGTPQDDRATAVRPAPSSWGEANPKRPLDLPAGRRRAGRSAGNPPAAVQLELEI
ncbi:hypothetical protein [Streptomyces sp. NPDC051214]|uniref:hypothetical protein n=1 Tax=Streptomyces sp. NPDC051214 TaxID=3155282 RepID=UPI00342EB6A7